MIFSFEPVPDNYEDLKNVVEEFGTTAYQLALSNVVGEVEFFTQTTSHLGGLLPINKVSKDSLGYTEKAENQPIKVSCTTLDDFCNDNHVEAIDLLKIDVQGAEVSVLKGGKNILNSVKAIIVEISLYDFYVRGDGSSWSTVFSLLDQYGFSMWDIFSISKNPKNLRTDWMEVVFVRVN